MPIQTPVDPVVYTFEAGQIIFSEGDPAQSLLQIEEGVVEIWRTIDGRKTVLQTLGPGGVFSVETKVRRGGAGEPCRIDYDGNRVLVNGLLPERDPVAQARRQARWLAEFAKETTRAEHAVRPVVWYVDAEIDGEPEAEVWVVNERSFARLLKSEPERLSREEIDRLAEAFSKVARSAS